MIRLLCIKVYGHSLQCLLEHVTSVLERLTSYLSLFFKEPMLNFNRSLLQLKNVDSVLPEPPSLLCQFYFYFLPSARVSQPPVHPEQWLNLLKVFAWPVKFD